MLTPEKHPASVQNEQGLCAGSELEREKFSPGVVWRQSSSPAHRSGTRLQTHGSLGYERNAGREISSAVASPYLLQPKLVFLHCLLVCVLRALMRRIVPAAVTAQSPESASASLLTGGAL